MHKYAYLILICIGLSFQVAAQEIPRDTTFNVNAVYKKYSKYYPEASIATVKGLKGVVNHQDVTYLTLEDTPYGKRDLHVDIYRPKKKGKYPALLMVHGGGWRAGDKSLQNPMAEAIAAQGYVTICVEYQLSLEAPYPAALHNIKAAIRWARANAEEYNIDIDKIAVSGCSAGGQLALLTGLTNGVKEKDGVMGDTTQRSDVQAILDLDGVINFMAPLSLNLNRGPNSPDVEWLGGTFYEKPEIWKDASPIYWANENSVPILFLNSGFPRFTAGQAELIGMMNDWGIYTEVHKFDINIHAFWILDPWMPETVGYMVGFMDKVLKGQD